MIKKFEFSPQCFQHGLKQSLFARITSVSMMSQYYWKNFLVNPSDLGALMWFMSKNVARMASRDDTFHRLILSTKVTKEDMTDLIRFKYIMSHTGAKKRCWYYPTI